MEQFKNPLFESFYEKAKIQPIIFDIYEDESVNSMGSQDVKKYFMEILNPLQLNISSYIVGYPIEDERTEILKKYLAFFPKLEDSSSLQDIIDSLIINIWEDIVISQVKRSPKKEILEPVYARVNAGIKELKGAFEELKKKSGDNINNNEVIESANSEMKKILDNLKSQIKDKYKNI
jgi:hypothetical protein